MSIEQLSLIVSIIGVLVGGFISYHLYFLSKRLTVSDKLSWRFHIRGEIDEILLKMKRKELNSKCEIININRYVKDYPHKQDRSWLKGYTYLAGELKDYVYDGLEFIIGIEYIYKSGENYRLRKYNKDKVDGEFKVFVVGVIPYEWIVSVDLRGDEFSYRPQFYAKFKGKGKYPYRYQKYYRVPETEGGYMHLVDGKVIDS